ncbi:MAG: asparagine synthase (glutamine-hydrolyzing) [Bacteroidia bacterium]|nr:asparagine synthase (glutamine-hydrolyzing) [Bacteroidia bacterium]
MCGLAGYYFWRKAHPPSLHEALRLLRHRGPDAARIWQSHDSHVGLAHTRLSILDLSEEAHQPFQLDRTWIVYNGEVYNFQELRSLGNFKTRTRSDTEVLLWAYRKWGISFVEKLEGMFAFALYDEDKDTLLLARDPFGIKPLWVAVRSEGIYFASELKVLTAWLPNQNPEPAAVGAFLHLGFVPAPMSWYSQIYKVLPGEVWEVSPKGYTAHVYYDRERLWSIPKLNVSVQEAEERLAGELRRAVRTHLVSDVPVGLFLSGGTDSSLVAAAAAVEGYKLKAFTISFSESTHDELPYAQAVAQHLGLPLEYQVLTASDALRLIPQLSQWYDEPFGDVSALPTYLVSQLAARSVKVVLAGDGGDELFWGYGRYRWARRLKRMRAIWRISAPFFQMVGTSRMKRVGELVRLPSTAAVEHIFSQEQYAFSHRELKKLMPDLHTLWKTPHSLPLDPVEAQAAWDFLHYLPDDLLTKVDRASMQHSLEVRVPLLDKSWVALAWCIPNRLKFPEKGSVVQYKPLLRRILRRHLPSSLVERKKWGFTVPLAAWLRGPLHEWARSAASPRVLSELYGISASAVDNLWRRFEQGENFLATRLWLLAQIGDKTFFQRRV